MHSEKTVSFITLYLPITLRSGYRNPHLTGEEMRPLSLEKGRATVVTTFLETTKSCPTDLYQIIVESFLSCYLWIVLVCS